MQLTVRQTYFHARKWFHSIFFTDGPTNWAPGAEEDADGGHCMALRVGLWHRLAIQ